MENTILTEHKIARARKKEKGGRLLDISKFYISGALKSIAIRRQFPAIVEDMKIYMLKSATRRARP